MSGTTTINLLQAINRAITGVRKAPAVHQYPPSIITNDLPMILTWPSDATWERKGGFGALNREDRTYRIIAFVEPVGQKDIPTRLVAAVNLLVAFEEAYLLRATSNILLSAPTALGEGTHQIVIAGVPQSDGGIISNLSAGGVPFHGFELRIAVRELW